MFFALIFASLGIGHAKLKFPDVAKGSHAVARVFRGAVRNPLFGSLTTNIHSRPRGCPPVYNPLPIAHTCPRTTLYSTRVYQEIVFFSFNASAGEDSQSKCMHAVIDRDSLIDATATNGIHPTDVPKGRLELRDVTFAYPQRPDVPVFKCLNLTVPAGRVTALVGESGGGKSTIVNLVQRFYDVQSGTCILHLSSTCCHTGQSKIALHKGNAQQQTVPQKTMGMQAYQKKIVLAVTRRIMRFIDEEVTNMQVQFI